MSTRQSKPGRALPGLTFTFNINLNISADPPLQQPRAATRTTESLMDIRNLPEVFDSEYIPSAHPRPVPHAPYSAELNPLVSCESVTSFSRNNSLWESPVSSTRSNAKFPRYRYAHSAESIEEIAQLPSQFGNELIVPSTLSPVKQPRRSNGSQGQLPSYSPVKTSLTTSSNDSVNSISSRTNSSSVRKKIGCFCNSPSYRNTSKSSSRASSSSSKYFSPRDG